MAFGSPQIPQGPWPCTACTYQNEKLSYQNRCEICNNLRSNSDVSTQAQEFHVCYCPSSDGKVMRSIALHRCFKCDSPLLKNFMDFLFTLQQINKLFLRIAASLAPEQQFGLPPAPHFKDKKIRLQPEENLSISKKGLFVTWRCSCCDNDNIYVESFTTCAICQQSTRPFSLPESLRPCPICQEKKQLFCFVCEPKVVDDDDVEDARGIPNHPKSTPFYLQPRSSAVPAPISSSILKQNMKLVFSRLQSKSREKEIWACLEHPKFKKFILPILEDQTFTECFIKCLASIPEWRVYWILICMADKECIGFIIRFFDWETERRNLSEVDLRGFPPCSFLARRLVLLRLY